MSKFRNIFFNRHFVEVMAIRVGIGFSQGKDVVAAGRLAAEQSVRESGEPVLTLLFCTGDYARGEVLRAGDTDNLLSAAAVASGEAAKKCPSPKVVLLFDCVSRYLLMPKAFAAELASIAKNVKEDVSVLGMLSFGEVSSISGVPLFYNKSLTIAAGGDTD